MRNWFSHAHMAQLLGGPISSAGFVRFPDKDGNPLLCYGEAVSLNVKSDEKDTEYLSRRLNKYGF